MVFLVLFFCDVSNGCVCSTPLRCHKDSEDSGMIYNSTYNIYCIYKIIIESKIYITKSKIPNLYVITVLILLLYCNLYLFMVL